MAAQLKIGEVGERAGLRASAIRYYESIGILPAPRRVSGQRRYNPDVLYLLRAIEIAKQAGFTMFEIRQLFGDNNRGEPPSTAWERLARRKLQEVDALIERANVMRDLLEEGLRCGCLGLEECRLLGPVAEDPPSQLSPQAGLQTHTGGGDDDPL